MTMRFSIRRLNRTFSIVLCAAVSGVLSSSALAAPVAPKATTKATSKPTPRNDPRARAAFDRMRAAYDAFETYSMTMSTHVAAAGRKPSTSQARFFFRKPNRLALLINSPQRRGAAISNGSTFYVYTAGEKKYSTHPMPPVSVGRAGLMQYQAVGFLTPMLAGVDPFAAPWGQAPKAFALGKPGVLGGDAVERVMVFLPGARNQVLSYLIGKKDHLLRRAHFTAGTGQNFFAMTETYSAIKINPRIPLETFTFRPPAGVHQDTTQEEIYWDENLKAGSTPPTLETTDTQGNALKLEEFKGKVVLLDFWATWCGPCKEELPHVKAAYEKYHDKGFEIVGISFDEERKELDDFTVENGMTWRQVFDGKMFDSEANRDFKVKAIPFTLLIGRDGKIAAVNPRTLFLEPAIEKALAQTP
jgi:thiol-disulfide isomerase/thioredoxin/outer membrane lipoprotein-sorting protein